MEGIWLKFLVFLTLLWNISWIYRGFTEATLARSTRLINWRKKTTEACEMRIIAVESLPLFLSVYVVECVRMHINVWECEWNALSFKAMEHSAHFKVKFPSCNTTHWGRVGVFVFICVRRRRRRRRRWRRLRRQQHVEFWGAAAELEHKRLQINKWKRIHSCIRRSQNRFGLGD